MTIRETADAAEPGDGALVQAVLGGDRAAYGELYDRYARLVRAICFDAAQDVAGAQDLAQEVFLRAYQRLGTLRDPDRFGAWLIAIARTTCREWRRRQARDRHRYVEPSSLDPAAGQEPCDHGQIELLQRALRSLPEKERLALHAFYLLGKSPQEARRALGLSRSGLYRVVARARRRLRRRMRTPRED